MSYTDNNTTDFTNRTLFKSRRSLYYAIGQGCFLDLLFTRPSRIASPVQKGILDHVHTRVAGPFSQKFSLSHKNEYFFKPITMERETHEFAEANTREALTEQICSILFPILTFLDPMQLVINAGLLTALYLTNVTLCFCKAMFHVAKETLNGRRDYSVAVEDLKETASNFLIALCMPVIATSACLLDCVRLLTRCVATLVDLLVPLNSKDSLASPAA